MKRQSVLPDEITYGSLTRACEKGQRPITQGAGKARRFSKLRGLQEVLSQWHGPGKTGPHNHVIAPEAAAASPHQVCDREMKAWEAVWSCHALEAVAKPVEFEDWADLPPLTPQGNLLEDEEVKADQKEEGVKKRQEDELQRRTLQYA